MTLTAELVDSATEIAAAEALTLAGIKQRLQERHPDAPDFSLDRLGARGLRFKRCRLSLKKATRAGFFRRKSRPRQVEKRANILGALDYATNTVANTSIKRTDVVAFSDRLARQYRDGKLTFVVLDNASIHRHIEEKKIRAWLCDHRLILFPLPPYSPELNLIEIPWKHAKYYWRIFTAWTKQDLLREVDNIFQVYGDKFEISYA